MKTILEILKLSQKFLIEKKIENPKKSSEEILAYVLGLKRLELYLYYDQPLAEKELEQIRLLLKKRGSNILLEYVIGVVQFSDCKIDVTPDVLIPRPETELLLQHIGKYKKNFEKKVLFDMCTGSGALAIAIKKMYPELIVYASDICEKALAIAKENALKNQVDVSFFQGDLLHAFNGKKADFLICNPPYLSEEEYIQYSLKEEPKKALVSGLTGFEMYQKLSKNIDEFILPGGKVFFEIGFQQAEKVKTFFTKPCWQQKETFQDWSGKDRFFFLEKE